MVDHEKDARQIAEIWQHHKTFNDGLERAALYLEEEASPYDLQESQLLTEKAAGIRKLKESKP